MTYTPYRVYKMADLKSCLSDFFPDHILIDILSYLSVRDLVRSGRVCKRWRRLVKDQRLWRSVDLSEWKGVTSRLLWVLLRQYLGCGLRCLCLRGLLLSARGGSFLSESWLQALSSRCPRLRKLSLLHVDLRGLHSCLFLPLTLEVLELHGCELAPGFFSQSFPSSLLGSQGGAKTGKRVGRVSSVSIAAVTGNQTGNVPGHMSRGAVAIETLVLDNVPSFTDLHLQSLSSWERLRHLELWDVIRVTAAGLCSCASREGGVEGSKGLSRLKTLQLGNSGRLGSQTQMVSLGLGEGWTGLQELTLGGQEVGSGLLCISQLQDLRQLRLHRCVLSDVLLLRSCRGLRHLHRLEFCEVTFQRHLHSRNSEEDDVGGYEVADYTDGEGTPTPVLYQALASMLPQCVIVFTHCSITLSSA